jgi:uncharacterized protein (DUF305 family)
MNKYHNPQNMIKTDTQYIHHMIPHYQVAIDMCKIILHLFSFKTPISHCVKII